MASWSAGVPALDLVLACLCLRPPQRPLEVIDRDILLWRSSQ